MASGHFGRFGHCGGQWTPAAIPSDGITTRDHVNTPSRPDHTSYQTVNHQHIDMAWGMGLGEGVGGCELGRNICKDLIKDRILTLNILYTVYNIYRYTWVRLSVPVGYACRIGMKMCVPMSWVRLSCVPRSGNRHYNVNNRCSGLLRITNTQD